MTRPAKNVAFRNLFEEAGEGLRKRTDICRFGSPIPMMKFQMFFASAFLAFKRTSPCSEKGADILVSLRHFVQPLFPVRIVLPQMFGIAFLSVFGVLHHLAQSLILKRVLMGSVHRVGSTFLSPSPSVFSSFENIFVWHVEPYLSGIDQQYQEVF